MITRIMPRGGWSVQRPCVRRTGQSMRGHAHRQHSCDAARIRRSAPRSGGQAAGQLVMQGEGECLGGIRS
jgi:hypothetical protein